MTVNTDETSQACEVVGIFSARDGFEKTVAALKGSGFESTDLSVLASHESIAAAGKPERTWKEVLTAMVGELRFEGPLVASGAIVLAGGPTAAAIAAIIGAAVSGVAVKELLDEVTARPHTEQFERSLAAGGLILWVRAESDEQQRTAIDILTLHGAANVHVHPGPNAAVE